MTVVHRDSDESPALFGQDGELVSVFISIEPRLLEDLLEALATVEFPINPQLYHQAAQVSVEFPAYSSQIEAIRRILMKCGFNTAVLTYQRVLARAQNACH